MPFFLEDYDSDWSLKSVTHLNSTPTAEPLSEQPQERTQRAGNPLTSKPETLTERTAAAASKKRKRGGILHGLDMNNIIEVLSDEMEVSTVEDSVPTSSVPFPSRKTRGSANSTRVLFYDQKYHPLDEVLRPSQAAKRRAEHGIDADDESNDSSSFNARDQCGSDSDSDVEGKPYPKRYKHLDGLSTRCSTRRSSRKAGRNAVYNTNVHPQDSQLMLTIADEMTDVDEDSDVISVPSDVTNGSMNQVITITSSHSGDESEEVTYRMDGPFTRKIKKGVFQDINDNASDSTVSSPRRSTPQSSFRTGDQAQQIEYLDIPIDFQGDDSNNYDGSSGSVGLGLEQTPFEIYEEPLEEQLAKEDLAPSLPEFEHDDKENLFSEAHNVSLFGPNIQARAVVQTSDTHNMFQEHREHLGPSLTFDGTNDRVRAVHRFARLPPLFDDVERELAPRIALSTNSDTDSVLGSPIRRRYPDQPR